MRSVFTLTCWTALAVVAASQVRVDPRVIRGQAVPGAPTGWTVNSTGFPTVSGSGRLAVGVTYNAPLTTSTVPGVFLDGANVFLNTDVSSPVITGRESWMGVSDHGGGSWIIAPTLDGEDGNVLGPAPFTFFNETDPMPGGGFSSFNSRVDMADDGFAYWVGGGRTTVTALTTWRTFMRMKKGDAVPTVLGDDRTDVIGGLALTVNGAYTFEYDVSPNGLFTANVIDFALPAAEDLGIVKNLTSIVARESLPLSDTTTWTTISECRVDNSGRIFVRGSTSGPTTANQLIAEDSNPLLREGIVLDGYDTTNQNVVKLSVANVTGQTSPYLMSMWGTATSNHRMFVSKVDDVAKTWEVLKVGDLIDLDNNGTADASIFSISPGTGNSIALDRFLHVYADVVYRLTGSTVSIQGVVRIPYPMMGDVNRDQEVGPADFSAVLAAFGAETGGPTWNPYADVDENGEIGPGDFSSVLAQFGFELP